jgi:outer membrane protein assembly factor BamB
MYSASWSPSPLVVTAFNGHVIAIDPRTGGVAWQRDLAISYDLRLDVGDSLVVALGVKKLVVLEYLSGNVVFELDVPSASPTMTTMLVDGGLVYLSTLGSMTCISLAERRALWSNDLPGTGNGHAAIGVPGRTVQADLGRR